MTASTKFTRQKPLQRIRLPARLYFAVQLPGLFWSFLKKLRRGREVRRHTYISKALYDVYDTQDITNYFHGARYTTTADGWMQRVSFREIRALYLQPVRQEIERLLDAGQDRVSVLEVGCGNLLNLVLLREVFGDRVELNGIDISARRIEIGQQHWGAQVQGMGLYQDSATELRNFQDKSIDLVFSMHCLEQIPYLVPEALAAMRRVARARVVFVEPVFEFGNVTQKAYSVLGDQLRTLLPELGRAGLTVLSSERVPVLANPLNQTGAVVTQP